MRPGGTPRASSSCSASSLSAANHAERNSSRNRMRPNGLRAKPREVAMRPGAEDGHEAGQAEQAAAKGDRGRRQRAVRVHEVDAGTPPQQVPERGGDVDDRGERRLPGERRATHHRASDRLRARRSPDRPRDDLGLNPAIEQARHEALELQLGATHVRAKRLDDESRARSASDGPCHRPGRLRIRPNGALGLGAQAGLQATWPASSPARPRPARSPRACGARRRCPLRPGRARAGGRRSARTAPSRPATRSPSHRPRCRRARTGRVAWPRAWPRPRPRRT